MDTKFKITSQFTRIKAKNNNSGFTLFELIITLVIVGIISVVVGVRWTPTGDITGGYQASLLSQHIRQVQSLAMNWETPLQLEIAGSSYAIRCVTGTGNPPCINAGDIIVNPANQQAFTVNLKDSVSLAGTNTEFDSFGRPNNVGGGLLTAVRTLTLSNGTVSWNVNINPITGFTQVAP